MSKIRLVCISDTHNQLDKVNIPAGDILLHAGDLTGKGTIPEVQKELYQLSLLNFSHKLTIAGNHDFLFEKQPALAKQLCEDNGIIYIHEKEIIINGVKFYGANWQPEFFDWAFNLKRGKELEDKWALIPDDTNVLITHGPPMNILDKTPDHYTRMGQHVGCEDLTNRIKQLKELKLHVFGHIHHGYGHIKLNDVMYCNASICNEQYKPVNKPYVFDIDTEIKEIVWVN
jgi:Icc-related predicted phosphoesterase